MQEVCTFYIIVTDKSYFFISTPVSLNKIESPYCVHLCVYVSVCLYVCCVYIMTAFVELVLCFNLGEARSLLLLLCCKPHAS